MGRFAHAVQHAFRTMTYMPIAFITAKTGKNVKALLNLVPVDVQAGAAARRHRARSTGCSARRSRPTPRRRARTATPRIYYATQVGTAPPTIVLFVNNTSLFDATYQRYLLNVFREKLPFRDIPIKLYLRARTQTDSNARAGYDPTTDSGPLLEDSHEAARVGVETGGFPELDEEVNELLADMGD